MATLDVMSDANPWVIYALLEPIPLISAGAVRYVGWTQNLKRRLRNHRSEAMRSIGSRKDTHKNRWIRALDALGLVPNAEVIERGTGASEWAASEIKWIAHHRAAGARLTNASGGGEGTHAALVSDETRAKVAKANTGKKQSPETIQKRVAKITGRTRTPEQCARIGAAQLGKKRSDSARANISAAMRGRPVLALRGRKLSPEHVARLSASHLGKKLPAERVEAMRQRAKGRTIPAETRAKMNATAAANKAAREAHREPDYRKGVPHLKMRGQKLSPEHAESLRRSLTGKKQAPETIAKRAASLHGKRRSEEQRARIAAGARAGWAKRKTSAAEVA